MYKTFVSGEGDLEVQRAYWRENPITRHFDFGSFNVVDEDQMQGVIDYLNKHKFPFKCDFLVVSDLLRACYHFRDISVNVVSLGEGSLLNICSKSDEADSVEHGLGLAS